MLTSLITNRFLKHHDLCLAYMDTLEEIAHNIRTSGNSMEQLEAHHEALTGFFHFAETVELQHQKEEEKVLLPVLATTLSQAKYPLPEAAIKDRLQEHQRSKKILAELKESWKELMANRPVQASEYYMFTSQILDLVWHLRRHIWEENALILPAAQHLIPDAPDPVWIRRGGEHL